MGRSGRTLVERGAWTARAVGVSGAGNRFCLVDRRGRGLPAGAAEMAVAACADSSGFAPDGVLWVLDGARGEDLCMVLHNADGSRPEACGNALRCLVYWAVEGGLLPGSEACIGTDGGTRRARWRTCAGELEVEVCLGVPTDLPARSLVERMARGDGPESERASFHRVSLANPHAVQCVEDEGGLADGRLERWGPRLQELIPGGSNVEFVARRGDGIAMRVWERGVGPTEACGTGSAAAAWVAAGEWGLEWPITVQQPGGMLTVDRDSTGRLWLAGPVRIHGELAFPGDEWVTCSTS